MVLAEAERLLEMPTMDRIASISAEKEEENLSKTSCKSGFAPHAHFRRCSTVLLRSWYLVLIGLIILIFGFSAFLRSEFGKKVLQQLQLKAPLIGALMQKVLIARFCQTLGTLLGSGVDLKTALEISRHVVVNQLLIDQLNKMIIEVNNKGIPLSAAMGRTGYFPDYVQHVVAIGEEAARVDELLERVANRMQEEVSRLLEGLTALLQPTMIVLMGVIVGFIALSVLLPMLNMNQLLGR